MHAKFINDFKALRAIGNFGWWRRAASLPFFWNINHPWQVMQCIVNLQSLSARALTHLRSICVQEEIPLFEVNPAQ